MTTLSQRLTLLAAVSVLAAGPALAQEIVGGRTAPLPDATKAAIERDTAAEAAGLDPLPPGTPTDDYQFMGWCTGILTGHMDLYTKVKPQLTVISKRWNSVDEDAKQEAGQQTEGRALLGRFRKVMAQAEAQKPGLGPSGQAAVQQGLDNWKGIDKVDAQTQAYSWMNFGLPGQCETKVSDLEKHPISLASITPAPATAAKGVSKASTKTKTKAAPQTQTASAKTGDPKTLHGAIENVFGSDDPDHAVGKKIEIAPGVIADPNKSMVAQLAEQRAAQKKAAADKKAAEAAASSNAAGDAGLRP
jgi:hypothetical protein